MLRETSDDDCDDRNDRKLPASSEVGMIVQAAPAASARQCNNRPLPRRTDHTYRDYSDFPTAELPVLRQCPQARKGNPTFRLSDFCFIVVTCYILLSTAPRPQARSLFPTFRLSEIPPRGNEDPCCPSHYDVDYDVDCDVDYDVVTSYHVCL